MSKIQIENKKMMKMINWMRSREEQILERLDLDELDLLTDRLKMIFKPMSESENSERLNN
jgi:hypothetical protein